MSKFKKGERILVRDDNIEWVERIFLCEIPDAIWSFACVAKADEYNYLNGKKVEIGRWQYARKILPHLRVDDKIIVGDKPTDKIKRHFSHWSDDGKPECFPDGKTSWTHDKRDKCVTWEYWELLDRD